LPLRNETVKMSFLHLGFWRQ